MLKKIEYTKNNLLNKKIENIFMCPICYNDIKIHNNSLICKNGHCYDISKKGYFTLLKKNKLRIDNENITNYNMTDGYINEIILEIPSKDNLSYIFYKVDKAATYDINEFSLLEVECN